MEDEESAERRGRRRQVLGRRVLGRRLLGGGAAVVAAGLGVSGTVGGALGSYVLLLGWALLIYGLHVFGRAGVSDESA